MGPAGLDKAGEVSTLRGPDEPPISVDTACWAARLASGRIEGAVNSNHVAMSTTDKIEYRIPSSGIGILPITGTFPSSLLEPSHTIVANNMKLRRRAIV